MNGVNKVILVGHLGRDPELREVGSGQKCTFTLATSRTYRNKQGNEQTHTQWHRVVTWGNLAGLVGQYAKKGRLVYVEGALETREFETNGEKQRVTEVNARTVEFLGGRDDSSSRNGPGSSSGSGKGRPSVDNGYGLHGADLPVDVPF